MKYFRNNKKNNLIFCKTSYHQFFLRKSSLPSMTIIGKKKLPRFRNAGAFILYSVGHRPLFSSSVQETANSKEDDKAGNYTGPNINLA